MKMVQAKQTFLNALSFSLQNSKNHPWFLQIASATVGIFAFNAIKVYLQMFRWGCGIVTFIFSTLIK